MGWGNGIGIGWPNASAQATPPLPLETYLISDCLNVQVPRWSQYLPIGTLLLGQRVPTTSSTEIATYGLVQEIGTTFGPLVAEPVTNIYEGCGIQTNIQLEIKGEIDGIYIRARTMDLTNISFTEGGNIPFNCYATFGDTEIEIIDNGTFADQTWDINSDWTTIFVYPIEAGGAEVVVSNPIIYGISINNFYNYGDALQNNSTQIITLDGDLWNWTYTGQF
jgi:hypothetical protein